jgi:Kef-type K+ transport system membrane component KefB
VTGVVRAAGRIGIAIGGAVWAARASASTADPAPELGLVPAIGIAIVTAAVLAVVFTRLRQPALLAYIGAGLVIGRFSGAFSGSLHTMEQVSHLGLVFLLFIIGMEMDLHGVFRLGPRAAVAILLQAPVSIGAVLALQWGARALGVSIPGLGEAHGTWVYYAVAASLGSTAVVVKLLGDKFELGTQAGRVTVLTLIAQDVWAVLALSYVSAQGEESAGAAGVATMIGGAALLAVLCVLLARYVLKRVMAFLATSPDLIAVVALGWCFLWAQAFSLTGLSAEMGALLAGLTVSRLPERTEILSKVSSLRDFFMALFFVALGIGLPHPSPAVMLGAAALVVLVFLSRLVLFAPMLLSARLGPIVSLTAALNLSQLSEFSLLLVPIGLAQGVLDAHDAAIVSYGLMLSVALSSYVVRFNHKVAASLERGFRLKWPHRGSATVSRDAADHPNVEVVLLGFFQNADALALELHRSAPELLAKILVVDFNLKNHPAVRAQGMRVEYGDISNPELLRHHGLERAKVVVSTIDDAFLRGTSNAMLLDAVRAINPRARIIVTAPGIDASRELLSRGAFACIAPPSEAASAYASAIREALAAADDED